MIKRFVFDLKVLNGFGQRKNIYAFKRDFKHPLFNLHIASVHPSISVNNPSINIKIFGLILLTLNLN